MTDHTPTPVGLLTTRRGIVLSALAVGVIMAITLSAVVYIAISVNKIQQQQIKQNAEKIAVLERLQRLEKPTSVQITERIRRQFATCTADPDCLQAFKDIIPAGPPGQRGPRGRRGRRGRQGVQGVQGSTGPRGPQGRKGDRGPQGIPGNTGPQGPQGAPGISADLPSVVQNLCDLAPVLAKLLCGAP